MGRRGEGRLLYLSLHCHHQNDSCIKMGSDESHFNVSLTVRDKVTRQCPHTTPFKERRAEAESNRGPSANQPNALPLGQTGSRRRLGSLWHFTSLATVKAVHFSVGQQSVRFSQNTWFELMTGIHRNQNRYTNSDTLYNYVLYNKIWSWHSGYK